MLRMGVTELRCFGQGNMFRRMRITGLGCSVLEQSQRWGRRNGLGGLQCGFGRGCSGAVATGQG